MERLVDGALFANMVRGGAANLSANRKIVNDLNVFPIPDGDTGDNMYMTINSGVSNISEESGSSLSYAASCAAQGMLLGARGNSGVILSRIFAGISKGLEGIDKADVAALAKAFTCGVDEAYGAVAVPVEGTILTVYKDAVNFAGERLNENSSFDSYFDDFLAEMRRSLERTPDLLAVLKEAGVVDSGGAGFIYIAEGMKNALDGETFGENQTQTGYSAQRSVDLNAFTADSVLEFGYCTEFLLRLQRSKTDIDAFDLDDFIAYLNSVGNSVVAFREDTIIKVHVHTKKPGDILNECQKYGEFLTTKIENMTLQYNETGMYKRFTPKSAKPHKEYGIVSVAAGKGIKETFKSLGCDAVVDGGQSMNPSAEDLIKAFSNVNADTIFVFPNNSNIIMTAKQAASLYDKADVRIIPTRTIGEGYAAISMFDPSSGNSDMIVKDLEEVISGVVTGMVSKAVRDTEISGVTVRKDDYIGFVGDDVYIDNSIRSEAAFGLAEKLNAGRYDIMLVICGEDTPKEETDALYGKFKETFKRTEVIMIDGGQPIYDYIIILE